jgi:hypothetical protein
MTPLRQNRQAIHYSDRSGRLKTANREILVFLALYVSHQVYQVTYRTLNKREPLRIRVNGFLGYNED